jgi:hypothetical protein
MKNLIIFLIIMPVLVLANEPTMRDYYRMGYDEGIEYASKNKINSGSSYCADAGYCLSLSLTDIVMSFAASASGIILLIIIADNNDELYDEWGTLVSTAVIMGIEAIFFRGVNLLFKQKRRTDEFDLLKKKKDFPNDSYKARFIEVAKSVYNKKIRF